MGINEIDSMENRQSQIASFVRLKGYARLAELAELTGVSELTVRRDIKLLQERKILNAVHGGATSDEVGSSMISFKRQIAVRQIEKQAIGREAASLIHDGETVLIDGGTTTWYVCNALRGKHIRAITNSLPAADILGHDRGITINVLGGTLYPETGLILGAQCNDQIRLMRPATLIMGVGGITADGFTNSNIELVTSQRVMMEVSSRVVVVADSSKFGKVDLARLSDLNEADEVITDQGVSESFRYALYRRGVDLVIAKPERRNGMKKR